MRLIRKGNGIHVLVTLNSESRRAFFFQRRALAPPQTAPEI